MFLLAIDQGNTRTKFGIYSTGTLCKSWVSATNKTASADDLAHTIFNTATEIQECEIGLCTVVPELLPQWQQMAYTYNIPLTCITGLTPTPLRNAYETPETLGPDRLMAAVAAENLVGSPVIVLSLGTATVVDAVSRDATFLGGMIAPGIGTMARALTARASALQSVKWQRPTAAIARSSTQAMMSGLFYQSVGGIQNMVHVVRKELGIEAPIAITGGWASSIAPYLDCVALTDELLVLHGIALTLQQQNNSH
ncbi:MAG TPA: type III pantothenate kinase [Armatimonadota bacterium]|nr:type III pantothenate kinase [Armatimonadota bacterium]